MPDWKELYLTLMRDTEKAIRILEAAQLKCEELYLQEEDPRAPPPPSDLPRQATIFISMVLDNA